MPTGEGFRLDLPLDDALRYFRQQVNQPATIFSTDHWLTPKLEELQVLLSDPITADQAQALDDVLHGRYFMKDLIEWLKSPPMRWADFFAYREQRERDASWERWQRNLEARLRRWGRSAEQPKACPKCGSLSVVDIAYGFPAPETMEAARRGAVALGGCILKVGAPRWCCQQCKHRWV